MNFDDEQLDLAFAALANSTRRRILERLAEVGATVNELAEPFDMSLPAISKHIKVLEEAGLITRGRQRLFRPCAIDPDGLRAVAHWTGQYRKVWEQRFDQMADYLDILETRTQGKKP